MKKAQKHLRYRSAIEHELEWGGGIPQCRRTGAVSQGELFRAEVLNRRSARLEGQVLLTRSGVSLWLTVAILLCAAGLGACVLLTPYARTELARGHLVPTTGVVRIGAPVSGFVSQLPVEEGDDVFPGTLLVTLVPDRSGRGGEHSLLAELEALEVKEQALRNLISLARQDFDANAAMSQTRASDMKMELGHLVDGLAEQSALVSLAEQDSDRLAALLQRGTATQTRVQELRAKVAEQRRDKAMVERDIVQVRSALGAEQSRLGTMAVERDRRESELLVQIADIQAERARLRAESFSTVVATVSGTVSILHVAVGGHVRQSETVLQIVPHDAQLVAELFLPSRAAGFVRPGQQVAIRFAAFPYQTYGLFGGTVRTITDAALNPGEIDAPLAFNEPVYRVSVELDQESIVSALPDASLYPGMTLEANLILDRRPVYRWIADPVLSMLGGA